MKNSVTKDNEAAQLRSDKTNTLLQTPVLYNSLCFQVKQQRKVTLKMDLIGRELLLTEFSFLSF